MYIIYLPQSHGFRDSGAPKLNGPPNPCQQTLAIHDFMAKNLPWPWPSLCHRKWRPHWLGSHWPAYSALPQPATSHQLNLVRKNSGSKKGTYLGGFNHIATIRRDAGRDWNARQSTHGCSRETVHRVGAHLDSRWACNVKKLEQQHTFNASWRPFITSFSNGSVAFFMSWIEKLLD